jgi:Amidohydrolase family
MKKRLRFFATLWMALWPAASQAAGILVIRGGQVHTAVGDILDDAMIVVENGKIVSLGPRVSVPAGAKVLDARGCILYPGFIAVVLTGDLKEGREILAMTPDSLAMDVQDDRTDRRRLLAGGVTSLYISPGTSRFLPGRGSVIKPGGDGVRASTVREAAALGVNFAERATRSPLIDVFPAPIGPENPLVPSRRQFPSSSLEAYWGLRELLLESPFQGEFAAEMSAVSGTLREVVEQHLPVVVGYQKPPEALRMIELSKELGFPLVLMGNEGTAQLADVLKDRDISVIAPFSERPLGLSPGAGGFAEFPNAMDPSDIAELIRRGVRVALCPLSDKDLPDLFRLTQYFRRYGLPPEKLLKTITVDPADMFGVADRIGSLRPGRDADILIYRKDGDKPFLKLKTVMIEGEIVHEE